MRAAVNLPEMLLGDRVSGVHWLGKSVGHVCVGGR